MVSESQIIWFDFNVNEFCLTQSRLKTVGYAIWF